MGRTERRLFSIADRMAELAQEEAAVREELSFHRHINDDAQRDAALSDSSFEKMEARLTAADVGRFERRLEQIDRERAKLETKRLELLDRLV